MRSFVISAVRLSFCAVLAAVLLSGTGLGEESFTVKRIGNLIPYEDNAFQIHAPEDGYITFRIHDDITVYREFGQYVKTGETTVHWDGCGFNREKLYPKSYTITAELAGESGRLYSVAFATPVGYSGQSLQYALPSSDILFLEETDKWFLEFKTVMKGTVKAVLVSESVPDLIFEYSMNAAGGKIYRRDFGSIAGNDLPPAGKYRAEIYAASNPEERYAFELAIQEGKEETKEVFITGEIMPERGMKEAEIWDMMMKPSIVVDIDFFRHQEVYEKPDSESRSLGTLHGQTQALKVIRIDSEWALIGAWNHEEAEYVEGWVPVSRLKVAEPQSEYGILIDKKEQTLTLYHKGKILDTLLVSTGRAEKNRYERETSAGSFLTGYHRVDFSMNGNRYDYVIQYDGGNLLHQTPYAWGSHRKDFTLGRGYLGAKASHACIRIQPEPGKGGVNAYWLWTHIPYHTRVLILDDPVERHDSIRKLKRSETLDKHSAADQIHIASNVGKADSGQIVLTFAGEMIPGGKPSLNNRKNSFVSMVTADGKAPFAGLREWFADDDCTCILLTGQLKKPPANYLPETEPDQAPPEIARIFSDGSVELVAICEDEAYRYGDQAIHETSDAIKPYTSVLTRNGFQTLRLKGHLFGFACCSESEYLKDPTVVDYRIGKLKESGCERTIFLCSWGSSREKTHTVVQEAMARRSVRAGADLVIGHHPSQVQGIDRINGVPVVYGTGLLLDGKSGSRNKQSGLMIRAVFSFEPDAEPDISIIPIVRQESGAKSKNAGFPQPVNSQEEAYRTISDVWEDSSDRIIDSILFVIPERKKSN